MMWHGHFFGGMFMMVLWPALILVVLFLVIRTFSRHDHGYTRGPGSVERALDILNERYSKGEIDDDEYLRRKKNLLNKQ